MNMNNDNFMNAVDIAALLLGIVNLQENRSQTAYNDVHAANDNQAKFLLQELDNRFLQQNTELEVQTTLLNEIYAKLSTEKNVKSNHQYTTFFVADDGTAKCNQCRRRFKFDNIFRYCPVCGRKIGSDYAIDNKKKGDLPLET